MDLRLTPCRTSKSRGAPALLKTAIRVLGGLNR